MYILYIILYLYIIYTYTQTSNDTAVWQTKIEFVRNVLKLISHFDY